MIVCHNADVKLAHDRILNSFYHHQGDPPAFECQQILTDIYRLTSSYAEFGYHRHNSLFYVRPISETLGADNVDFHEFCSGSYDGMESIGAGGLVRRGWLPLNPSAVQIGPDLWECVRTVNYRIGPQGEYQYADCARPTIRTDTLIFKNGSPIAVLRAPSPNAFEIHSRLSHVRNLQVDIRRDQDFIVGAEDVRLYGNGHDLCATATLIDQLHKRCIYRFNISAMLDGRLCPSLHSEVSPNHFELSANISLTPVEKNYCPYSDGSGYAYQWDPYVELAPASPLSPSGRVVGLPTNFHLAKHFRGGSPVVEVTAGGRVRHLAIIHEVYHYPREESRRSYMNRLVEIDRGQGQILAVSDPLWLNPLREDRLARKPIEFVSGLTTSTDGLTMYVGVNDRKAFKVKLSHQDGLEGLLDTLLTRPVWYQTIADTNVPADHFAHQYSDEFLKGAAK
jgi:hypothetical protein